MPGADITIRLATADDHRVVAALVFDLLGELVPDYRDTLDPDTMYRTACELFAGENGIWALLASTESGEAVGVLTLNECAALYARGRFGEISELYVKSGFRSAGVGAKLIDAACEFGRERKWSMIEVGAPDVPRWQRTVDFYLRYGFKEIGPRLEIDLPT